jgi:hypothetical protein
MPAKKKANTLSQSEQSQRFVEKVRELEADGKLSPTEAAKRFEKVMGGLKAKRGNSR